MWGSAFQGRGSVWVVDLRSRLEVHGGCEGHGLALDTLQSYGGVLLKVNLIRVRIRVRGVLLEMDLAPQRWLCHPRVEVGLGHMREVKLAVLQIALVPRLQFTIPHFSLMRGGGGWVGE